MTRPTAAERLGARIRRLEERRAYLSTVVADMASHIAVLNEEKRQLEARICSREVKDG